VVPYCQKYTPTDCFFGDFTYWVRGIRKYLLKKLEVAFHLYKKENQVSERPLAEVAEPNLHFQLPITYRKDRMT